jgi:NAD(P)-dependent dehydrogenase (short-subunit alcohol dehydrogenase family)
VIADSRISLDGRVALVTGASRGIGASCARAFSRAGASVAVAARNEAALQGLATEIESAGGVALVVPTDVTDASAIERLVERTMERFGRLDMACNNAAGGGQAPTRIVDLPIEAYDGALTATLRSVFLSMKYEIRAMLESGGGAIVNMGSTAGLEAVGGLAGYVSAKHGVVGLTRCAALEYADVGVRVNALAPGPILTETLLRAGPEMQQRAAQALPMRRIGHPEEVADAVVWLCSNHASFLTGATIPIDGGKLAGMAPFAGMSPDHNSAA